MRSLNLASIFCITTALAFSASTNGLAPGKVQLKSAGPLGQGRAAERDSGDGAQGIGLPEDVGSSRNDHSDGLQVVLSSR